MSKTRSLKNVETVERERYSLFDMENVYSTTHTSNILKEKKLNNVNRINKKQIELSSICVFLI